MKMYVKLICFVILLASLSFIAISAQARNTRYFLPIKDVIKMGRANGTLGNDIGLHFGSQSHPPVEARLVTGVVTNKKTNAINSSDRASCKRVMLSALIQLQDRARNEGGNAVINIKSYYRKRTFRSNSQYECHAGDVFSGVALRGDVVRLRY
ncbi:MAG: excinuclease ATPase subunit [Betaproteobacteria bacterium]|nr:excinuclease ATPase subunit [Betaproteobacteria bacterium]